MNVPQNKSINLPILYQNTDCTVTLIDIPASIAHAQGIQTRVFSSQARQEPFPSTEPKTEKAREKLLARVMHFQHDVEYSRLVDESLELIHQHYKSGWCSPRWTLADISSEQSYLTDAEKRMADCIQFHSRQNQFVIIEKPNALPMTLHEWDGSFYNDSPEATKIRLPSGGATSDTEKAKSSLAFLIPFRASFLLSDCNTPGKLRNHIRWLSQNHDKPRKFDFILLDPPWENRSVKRKANYQTNDVFTMIKNMDLSSYLQPGGLVGFWVTNKAAHRDLILGEGGLLEHMNVSLVEEWIWMKTTANGEPVTKLDGLWRKPYEVFLLGKAPGSSLQMAQPAANIARRVIAGVPDLHSRKPCLKTLIEPLLPKEHQVLEVFARYLVQGWTSWGNEVLKYNWDGFYEDTNAFIST